MQKLKILDASEIQNFYGDFYRFNQNVAFDSDFVPDILKPLIPYARFWGVTDDSIRESLVDAAPQRIKDNLEQITRMYDDEFDEWLAGPEVSMPTYSEAYLAFSALRMAIDFF